MQSFHKFSIIEAKANVAEHKNTTVFSIAFKISSHVSIEYGITYQRYKEISYGTQPSGPRDKTLCLNLNNHLHNTVNIPYDNINRSCTYLINQSPFPKWCDSATRRHGTTANQPDPSATPLQLIYARSAQLHCSSIFL